MVVVHEDASASEMPADLDSDDENVWESDEEDIDNSVAEAVLEEFNIPCDNYDWHEFDFPDFNLDDEFSGIIGNDAELDWVNDSLLELVCMHQLDAEGVGGGEVAAESYGNELGVLSQTSRCNRTPVKL